MTRCEQIVVTTDASGAGTALSARPLSGLIREIRMPNAGTAMTVGGSADFTFTRLADGGTILTLTNQNAPFQIAPSQAYSAMAGGAVAGTASVPGIPIDDHLKVVVAQGALSKSGTIYVHVTR